MLKFREVPHGGGGSRRETRSRTKDSGCKRGVPRRVRGDGAGL